MAGALVCDCWCWYSEGEEENNDDDCLGDIASEEEARDRLDKVGLLLVFCMLLLLPVTAFMVAVSALATMEEGEFAGDKRDMG